MHWTIQWRYYGPVCARRSVNGLFRQNGSVFGPVLPQKSTFSGTNVLVWYIIRIVRARVIYLSTENNFNKLESMFDFNFSHEKHILSLAMVTDRQTIHTNTSMSASRLQWVTCKSISFKFQILYDSFFIWWWEYILVFHGQAQNQFNLQTKTQTLNHIDVKL